MPLWVAGDEGVAWLRLAVAGIGGAGDWFGGRGAALRLAYMLDGVSSSGAGGG